MNTALDEGQRIRVLSLNIFIRPPGLSTRGDDYKSERIAEFVHRHLKHYDVVCLQEMFACASCRQRNIIQAAHARGFHHHVAGPWGSLWKAQLADGGLLILSRLPIVESDSIVFVRGVNSDGFAAKGALYAHIQVRPDVFFHLFTTHTQASYSTNSGPQDFQGNSQNDTIRARQFAQLREFMRSKVDRDTSFVLLVGDMNVDGRTSPRDGSDSEAYGEMIRALRIPSRAPVRDLVGEVNGGEHPITVGDVIREHGNEIPREAYLTETYDHCCQKSLDYLFAYETRSDEARDACVTVWEETAKVEPFFTRGRGYTQLSDHYGVAADLRGPPSG